MNNFIGHRWSASTEEEILSGEAVFIIGDTTSESLHLNHFKTALYIAKLLQKAYDMGRRHARASAIEAINRMREDL